MTVADKSAVSGAPLTGLLTVAVCCEDVQRRRALIGAIFGDPGIGDLSVARSGSWDGIPPCHVFVIDRDLDRDPIGLGELEHLASRHPVLGTAPASLRHDVWMFRSSGARGFLANPGDRAEVRAAIRTIAGGGEHWPAGLGGAPSWLAQPFRQRICSFVRSRERAKLTRLMNDRVLRALDGLAVSVQASSTAQRVLSEEAARLRILTANGFSAERGSDLDCALAALIAAYRAESLEVGLSIAAQSAPVLRAEVTRAFIDAANEALRNVVKHSGADQAQISVVSNGASLTVTISDEGRGFNTASSAPGFGLGESIHERMRSVGGRAEICSSPGIGTCVILSSALLT